MTDQLCPLNISPLTAAGHVCQGETCAWWSAENERCAGAPMRLLTNEDQELQTERMHLTRVMRMWLGANATIDALDPSTVAYRRAILARHGYEEMMQDTLATIAELQQAKLGKVA